MKPRPAVAIIILNWNGWRDTLACVDSCRKLAWPNFRIIVVDNASTDGSENFLRQTLADAEILQSGANLGFAGGNNVGIRRALDNGADYVWLLNNDTVVEPNTLAPLVAAMEHAPVIGIAGSKIYYHADPARIWSAGGCWTKGRLWLRQRGANRLDAGGFDETCEVGSVSGCSMLVRGAVIREIGLMEETFFLYWEDTEWCARAREQGYKVLFVPDSHVWHKVSASTGHGSSLQYHFSARNGCRFLVKHDPLLLPLFVLYNILAGLKELAIGNPQPLRGLASGFRDYLQGNSGARKPGPGN